MKHTLSRRQFVAAGGALAALAMTQPLTAAAETPRRFKKALKYGMIGGDASPEEKLKLIRELGFDGVEPTMKDKVAPEELKAASVKSGVPIHGVVLGSVDGIEAAVDRAVLYASSSVLLVAGRVDEKMPYDKNYTETQAIIRRAIPYAAEKKIMLLVENVWNNFLLSPLEMARYIDELESEWVGVYFDVGNVARNGWSEHWIPVLGKRIHKLDVKSYSRTKRDNEGTWKGFDVPLGDGGDEIDWAAVRRELVAINYTGWVTAEVNGGDREVLADLSTRLDRILAL